MSDFFDQKVIAEDLKTFHGLEIAPAKEVKPLYEPPTYKKDCPPDRALLVSDGTHVKVLDYIGPALDYWFECAGLDVEDFDGEPPGIWIWEGTIVDDKYWTDYGYEYDAELSGETRPLTKEEWEDWKINDCPWDPDDWCEPQKSPPPAFVVDAQVDRIFDEVDDLFLEGLFEDVDYILENLDVPKTPTVLLVAYLSITLAAKDELKKRVEFFQKVKTELEVRENRPNLLKGLE